MDAILSARFRDRGDLLRHYRAALSTIQRCSGETGAMSWLEVCLALSNANAGPALLMTLWQLEQRAAETIMEEPAALGTRALMLCRHAGARSSRALLERLGQVMPASVDGAVLAGVLDAIASGAVHRPDIVTPITAVLEQLTVVPPAGLRAWIEDGLRLAGSDRQRRGAYFRLEDPLSRQRLAWHSGQMSFRRQEKRLALVTRLLWNEELALGDLPEGADRTRLAGGLLLVPPMIRDVPPSLTDDFAEAAVAHAEAHRRFTQRRFDGTHMKPLQMALICLLEDARVERLAGSLYPGLPRLWARFHRPLVGSARTAQALLDRLGYALAGDEDGGPDEWIDKGKALFERSFLDSPHDQSLCERIGRILGHDLGQMRIPFDARVYRIAPAYRDDGLGLFDFPNDNRNEPQTDIILDAARMENGDGRDQEPQDDTGDVERATTRTAAEEEEIGPLLAEYPEWDYRIRSDRHGRSRVFSEPLTPRSSVRFQEDLDAGQSISRQLAGQLQRSRLGRPERLRRQQDGEDFDIDAVHEMIVAQRTSGALDTNIYQRRQRPRGDMSVALLLDASRSTVEGLGDGRSILDTAALAVGLLASALQQAGDPFAIYGFRSNTADEVRILTVKDFDETAEVAIARLPAIEPAFSTRLGSALRHVSALLGRRRSHRKLLIVLTDGEPADIDVEDGRYLSEDARRAVLAAHAAGIDAFCVSLGDHASQAASFIFGPRNTLDVARIDQLPLRLSHLYYRLTVV